MPVVIHVPDLELKQRADVPPPPSGDKAREAVMRERAARAAKDAARIAVARDKANTAAGNASLFAERAEELARQARKHATKVPPPPPPRKK